MVKVMVHIGYSLSLFMICGSKASAISALFLLWICGLWAGHGPCPYGLVVLFYRPQCNSSLEYTIH